MCRVERWGIEERSKKLTVKSQKLRVKIYVVRMFIAKRVGE
jgi:hypothetical protein